MKEINMQPIGYVHNNIENKKDVAWGKDVSIIELNEEYHTGMAGLNDFSHATIIYYLDKAALCSGRRL